MKSKMLKCLIWDADETLWDGTITEGEVVLPPGRYELCAELCRRGVVQAIASKNNISDILLKLEQFNLTPFFVANQADFDLPKSVMIEDIVQTLGLSKFSDVVFIDDQDFNLAEVNHSLPDVITALPTEIDSIVEKYFTKSSYNEEDEHRVRRYKEEVVRKTASHAYGSNYQEFLKNCGLQLELSRASDEDMPRVLDLVKRANRMSVLAQDFTPEQLSERQHQIIVAKVKDNFGDYGLTGIVIASEDGSIVNSVNLLGIVISCRMQGKGIGSSILGSIINANQGKLIECFYRETEYNQGMKALFDWYKFSTELTKVEGTTRFVNTINEPVSLPEWVKITGSF